MCGNQLVDTSRTRAPPPSSSKACGGDWPMAWRFCRDGRRSGKNGAGLKCSWWGYQFAPDTIFSGYPRRRPCASVARQRNLQWRREIEHLRPAQITRPWPVKCALCGEGRRGLGWSALRQQSLILVSRSAHAHSPGAAPPHVFSEVSSLNTIAINRSCHGRGWPIRTSGKADRGDPLCPARIMLRVEITPRTFRNVTRLAGMRGGSGLFCDWIGARLRQGR